MSQKSIDLKMLAVAALLLLVPFMGAFAGEIDVPPVNPAEFSAPMDNLYLPMAVGDTYVYIAEDEDGLIVNEITNTGATVLVDGVLCYVIYDVEYLYPEEGGGPYILEETDDWLAWDNYGNVWYFGEDTIEYIYDDDWNQIGTSGEGSWESGVDGATAGYLMLAAPSNGDFYEQEYYEDEAEDMGKVLRLNAKVSLDLDDYEDCLVTKEWTALEPGSVEHKYYAPGVGLVYIEELKEKTVYVELVDIY